MINKNIKICVFSSSSNAIAGIYFKEAEKLGQIIGEKGYTLINGGANVGLMEAVTVAASQSGAPTIGIIPERFIKRSLTSENSRQVIRTKDMQERKAKMREMADAFIALPGGFGTLEEIMEVLTLRQLSYHKKPVVFINVNNFFEFLFKQFEKSFSENFIRKEYSELYFIADSAEQAIDYISAYEPFEPGSKWFNLPGAM
jgi:cytokinin riboside 5'-monophosphate phosphoribohydrolase